MYSTARLEHHDTYEGKRRGYNFNEVGENCVVTCVADEDGSMLTEAWGSGKTCASSPLWLLSRARTTSSGQ